MLSRQTGQDADTIGSIMFKKLFFGINKAKKEYEVYAKALNKLAKFNLKNKDNYNLGVKAYLLSSPKGATEMEAQLLFELKKAAGLLSLPLLTTLPKK